MAQKFQRTLLLAVAVLISMLDVVVLVLVFLLVLLPMVVPMVLLLVAIVVGLVAVLILGSRIWVGHHVWGVSYLGYHIWGIMSGASCLGIMALLLLFVLVLSHIGEW